MKHYFLPFITLIFFFEVPINCYADNEKIIIEKDFQESILILCKDSKKFKHKFEKTIKSLEKRKKYYKKGNFGYNNLGTEINKTKERFEMYKNYICGNLDGLPHLIADGDIILYKINKIDDLIIPSSIFLYSFGYIGWSARRYLRLLQTNAFINELDSKKVELLKTWTLVKGQSEFYPIEYVEEYLNSNVLIKEWEENFDPIILPEIKKFTSLETNEIIINIAAATYIMLTCFLWPLDTVKEYFTNSLLLSDETISISRH